MMTSIFVTLKIRTILPMFGKKGTVCEWVTEKHTSVMYY